jgi:hypothetical protein
LELEHEGKIQVLDSDNKTIKPAEKRRKLKGEATLGDNYYIERL